MQTNWKTKGILLTAPLRKDVDDVVRFIDEYLAPRGCNLVMLQVRYRYQFERHPECQGYDPLSKSDVKKLVEVCRRNGIRLVPKMNLFGHQSGTHNTPVDGTLHGHDPYLPTPDFRDGLLRAYPELDEQPHANAVGYSRSLCPTHPLVSWIVFDLMDELLEAFEADAIHIGMDEVFNIGLCPRCATIPRAKLFADWANALIEHAKAKGVEVFMWGDRLLNNDEFRYGAWESSDNATHDAIELIRKDITICDWHYENWPAFPSVEYFGKHGLRILVSVMKDLNNAKKFIEYAKAHDIGHVDGFLMTTWNSSGELARHILDGGPAIWKNTQALAQTIEYLFS